MGLGFLHHSHALLELSLRLYPYAMRCPAVALASPLKSLETDKAKQPGTRGPGFSVFMKYSFATACAILIAKVVVCTQQPDWNGITCS